MEMTHRLYKKKNIYIAAPLFSYSERELNAKLKKLLSKYLDVYLPQEDGGLMSDMVADGMDRNRAATKVFDADIDALEKCDVLLIVLDGRTIDEGAAFELGYAYALGKPCFGLQTDVRRAVHGGNNPMIDKALCSIFSNIDALLNWAVCFKHGEIALAGYARHTSSV